MHKDARQVELDLEANVNVRPVDSGRPPESKTTIWNLIETRALCVRQLLVLHRLFEARGFLPKETFPSWEVGALE